METINEPRIVTLDNFEVMGISTRTSNADEMSGNGNIPQLWMRFKNEGIIEQIPSRIDSNIVAVYTDYESDANGLYTLVVGGKTSHSKEMSKDMVVKEVPAGEYLVFTSHSGAISKVVFDTWVYIWEWFSHSDLKRSYVADFELYDERSMDPKNAQVDIYVGVE